MTDECSCAMTEASQRTCPQHGEDEWNFGCTDDCPEDCMADHRGEE